MNARRNVEDIYPLAPLQAGMLFHTLYEPESRAYFVQLRYALEGPLESDHFERAWQEVSDRHTALRAAVVWQGIDDPMQVVHRDVTVPVERFDWRDLSAAEHEDALAAYMDGERAKGFELEEPPLQRLALARTAADVHELVWNHHHVLLDGWSTSIVEEEVLACYAALCRGAEPELPEVPAFRSYIEWLVGQDEGTAERYWRTALGGMSAPTPLGVDRRSSERGLAVSSFELSRDTTACLAAIARDHRLTLNTVLQGAWALLLSRYSGDDEVVFGATVSGRPPELPEVESIVGMFMNTVPVRVRVPAETEILSWLGELQTRQLDAREFEYSSLVDIQGWSDVPRDLPLFESILVYQNAPRARSAVDAVGEGEQPSFVMRSLGDVQQTGYPLTIVAGADDRLEVELRYDRARFDRATMERMAGHFSTVLESVADDPRARLRDVELLTTKERKQLLVDWQRTAAEYPRERCVHELFEEQAKRAPEAVAIVDGEQRTSYGELDARANQLARELRGLGVGPEVVVGICVEHSVEMLVGLLGILKAGGAYLPLDPEHPQERLAFLLQDTRAPVIVIQDRLRERLPPSEATVLALDREWARIAAQPATAPEPLARSDNLVYVIYTSGSTGRPKGVMIDHRSLNNYLVWAIEGYGLEGASGAPMLGSIAFDLSIPNLFLPLIGGRDITLLPPDKSLEALGALLVEGGDFSLLKITPGHLDVLRAQLPDSVRLDSVRTYVVGADEVKAETVVAWQRLAPGSRIIDEYGPTETVVGCSVYEVPADQDVAHPVSIGKPIANTQMYVLDDRLEPVPVGVMGQLYIGGAGVARGYLNRADLTADRFLPDPYAGSEGARFYRTGDLARFLADGNLEFLGRSDHQVKIRGYRIELGEIEANLLSHPAVEEAAVAAREDEHGQKHLVGYVVPTAEITAAELREFLHERLPDYMLPTAFVFLDELPLSPGGKVDRRLLPEPDADAGEPYVAPRNERERLLADLWADVLGVERVGIHDNFFILGGHSLLATRLTSRLRERFRAELPVRAVFEAPTIAEFAATLTGEALAAAESIEPASRDDDLRLSFAQERLWFLDLLEPGSSEYVVSRAVSLRGALDREALERALAEVVARHEVLRTWVEVVDGKPLLRVDAAAQLDLPCTDLRELPRDEVRARARAAVEEQGSRTFDLARSPLVRAALIRLGDEEHVLCVSMHHIVTDGWSLGLLGTELGALYGAFARGERSPLADLSLQYPDYAQWQRRWLRGEELDHQLGYWRMQLDGLAPLDLPTDHPRAPVRSSRGAAFDFAVPRAVADGLDALATDEGATAFMILLAAFQVLLARYSGQEDVPVGTPIANRNRSEWEGLIGFFVNTLVLRGDLSGDPSFRELLTRTRAMALEAYAHQDLPFERLVEELRPDRDLSRTPLFQVELVEAERGAPGWELPGLAVEDFEVDTRTSQYDLSLTFAQREQSVEASFEYASDLFDAATIERMAANLQTLLASIVADPDTPVSELELLPARERSRLLEEWNDTDVDDGHERCLHELFEAQAARTPKAVALLCGEEELSYADLDARSNRLAHHLRARGVGPETLVAVCLDRSLDLVVALLGVLKAGAAYVPLDAEYPRERLALMLEDSGAPLLLTHERQHERLPVGPGVGVVTLDGEQEAIARNPEHAPPVTVRPDNLAYVIYTSGSTGRPKGVMIEHRSVVNFATAMISELRFSAGHRLLAITTLSFDIAVLELLVPLTVGTTVVIFEEAAADGRRLASTLEELEVTVMQATPATWQLLVDAGWQGDGLNALCGGDILSPALAGRIERAAASFWNLYGPTETTIWSTLHRVEGLHGASSVPLGHPIANTRLYVLDSKLRPVPVGVPGELFIGGDGVARGYFERPDLTAERFVPDLFSTKPGRRLYRTGDRVRYLADGNLEFLGRIDHQVKLRGFRIELGEIEARLLDHPEIAEAAVVARDYGPGDKRLVAYVVPVEDSEPEAAELRDHLREHLPEYMVPSAFVPLASFPLTPNGKVDRKRLPEPSGTRPELAGKFVAPRGEVEATIASIWSELLGVDRVGRDDSFFELGGHSLLATQMMWRVREQLGADLPLRSLFETPTVAGLAKTLAGDVPEGAPEQPASPLVLISDGSGGRPFFCVHEGTGNVVRYLPLAKRIGKTRPFYGIQARDRSDLEEMTEVGAMADSYVREIRAVQPKGPYLLGGWSFGGIVAFEMASRLLGEGEQVGLLAVVDSSLPLPALVERDERTSRHLHRLADLAGAAGDVESWPPPARRDEVVAALDGAGLSRELIDGGPSAVGHLASLMLAFHQALASYVPRPYPGKVDLVLAEEGLASELGDAIGDEWKRRSSVVEVHVVPGTHLTVMDEPNVAALAEVLERLLAACDARSEAPAPVAASLAEAGRR